MGVYYLTSWTVCSESTVTSGPIYFHILVASSMVIDCGSKILFMYIIYYPFAIIKSLRTIKNISKSHFAHQKCSNALILYSSLITFLTLFYYKHLQYPSTSFL